MGGERGKRLAAQRVSVDLREREVLDVEEDRAIRLFPSLIEANRAEGAVFLRRQLRQKPLEGLAVRQNGIRNRRAGSFGL